MRGFLWLAFLGLLSGCTAPQPPPAGGGSPAAVTTPATAPGAPPATGSPVPFDSASPAGPLTESIWAHWQGDILPWRAATYRMVFDVQNPLGLTEAEQREALAGLMRWKPAHGRYMFRMAELYEMAEDRWPDSSEENYGGARQTPEEYLISQIDKVLPVLQEQAGGEKAEAKPYPEKLGNLKQADKIEMFPDVPSWEKTVPREKQLDLAPLGVILPSLAEDWHGAEAARAAAELEAMKVSLREQIEGWDTIHRVATGNPQRVSLIQARAQQLASEKIDMMAIYEEAKPLARQLGVPES